jgi:hypothetical protein
VTYSGGDGLTGRVAEQRRDMIPRRCQRDLSLTWAPACVRTLNAPVGEWVWERRARESLERGRVSLEGASGPRARWSPTRGGVYPSNEVGRQSLERGGVSLVWHCVHRTKRSFARGAWDRRFRWTAEAARTVGPCHWVVIVLGAFCVL